MNTNDQRLLVGEAFSPWTKKARWALEYCGLAYRYREYTPTLSEPGLRWRLRQWRGRVSVPILFERDDVFRGSWAIACHANETGTGAGLGEMQEIRHWDQRSEAALAEARTAVVRRILGDDSALLDALPSFIPGPLRGACRFMARDALNRLDRKYAHLSRAGALRDALVEIRQALARSKEDYLLGSFSYADVTAAVVVEMLAPIAGMEGMGTDMRACWTNPELATEFADLVAWRDRLAGNPATSYSQFRAPPSDR